MKVLRTSEQVKIKVKDDAGAELFSFTVSPLTYEQKSEIQNCRTMKEGEARVDGLKAVRLAIKYALKKVHGLEDSDGEPYELEFEANKAALTDSCIDDILNTERAGTFSVACSKMLNGVYSELQDADGQPMQGVTVELPGADKKK